MTIKKNGAASAPPLADVAKTTLLVKSPQHSIVIFQVKTCKEAGEVALQNWSHSGSTSIERITSTATSGTVTLPQQ